MKHLAALALLAGCANAQAPEAGLAVVEYECEGGRLVSITFMVRPIVEPKLVELRIPGRLCRDRT